MDKIYSRKRIKVASVNNLNINNKNAKKLFSIFIIILISVWTFYNLFTSLNPIFENMCRERINQIGTIIMNEVSSEILANIDYKELVQIEKNESGNILKTDVVKINKIASDIAVEIEKKFEKLEDEKIKIPIGALSGNKYLSGSGAGINIKVIPTGNIETQIKNEFESQGINQTVYRIYLELTCKVSIATRI